MSETLTPQEVQADLTLEQLKQLVGLVEYDEEKDPFPVTGWDAIVFVVGQRHPGRALLPVGVRHGPGRLQRPRDRQPRPQGVRAQERLVPLRRQGRRRSRQPAARPPPRPRRRRQRHRPRGPRRRQVHRPRPRDGRDRSCRSPRTSATSTARSGSARSRRTATPGTRSSTGRSTTGPTCRATSPAPTTVQRGRGRAEAALPGARPRRRQRRARQDGRVGRLLQPGDGLREHGGVHRRRHRHRLLRADEQGRRERQPPGEVPAQRAGHREAQEPDRRVPRVLPGCGRAAPRAGDQRHHRAPSTR